MADASRPEGPTAERSDWRARPAISLALRLATAIVPALAAAGAAYLAGRAAPPPHGPMAILWWLSMLGLATVVGAVVARIVRRALPLAVLLQLALAFPDRAPSRFAIARTAGNVRRLEERIAEAHDKGLDDDPARAARQILELVAALSAHDRKTRGHSERVRAFADMLASELPLDAVARDRLRWAALLHDIGKLRVPPRILNKPGKPDRHEWERLQEHPAAGARLALPLLPWLGGWAATIEQHHERFDGRGYPNGLEGGSISMGARIVAVADSFEVMTAARAYKRPMSVPAARRELAACAAAQFDPDMVRAFLNISIGRLWWTVGPASWLAAAPVLGSIQRAALQVATAAKAATIAAIVGIAGGIALPALASATPGVPRPAAARVVNADGAGGQANDSATSDGSAIDPGSGSGSANGGGSDDGGGGGGGGLVDDPIGAVGSTGGQIVDEVTGTVDDVVGVADDAVDDAVDDVVGAAGEAVGGAGQVVGDTVDPVVETVDDLLHL